MRVALVSTPFNSVDRPALGVSLLKARLGQLGVHCDVHYLNLAFAQSVGLDAYRAVALGLPAGALAGEWVFAGLVENVSHPPGGADSDGYLRTVLLGDYGIEGEELEPLLRAREHAPAFLEQALEAVAWEDYDVVGFSSWCAQNLASLALARRLHERVPGVFIAFGGPNWRGTAGLELHRAFPFVDLSCSGDADVSFPAAVQALEKLGPAGLDGLPGVVWRERGPKGEPGELHGDGAPQVVDALDALPLPDFSDYYEARRRHDVTKATLPTVVLETSRGCWWAEKSPCRFCGMDGDARRFRTKSPARILDDLRELAVRWPTATLYIIDDVVSPAFLSDVLPELAAHPLPVSVYLNVRPDVDRETVKLLGAVSASVQPGIESLNDHILRLMGKGVSALANIRMLKWCRTFGVRPHWNLLHGFPGETDEDYDDLLALLPKLTFLTPPDGVGHLSLDRRSAFFARPRRYGITDVRPHAPYSFLYAPGNVDLEAVALAFDYGYEPGLEPPARAGELREAVERWRRVHLGGDLRCGIGEGKLIVLDARPGATRSVAALDDLDTLLFTACDDIRTRRSLHDLAVRLRGRDAGREVDERLRVFVDHGQMVRIGERFLSLAPMSDEILRRWS